jgi:signal transduction histidine kinase
LLVSAYFWRTRQIKHRYTEKLNERLEERERIARALHDTLLQGMQGLILKFHSMAKRLAHTDQTRLGIENILDQADVLMAEGRAELLSLRSHAESSDNLPEAVQKYGATLQEAFGAQFNVAVLGKVRGLERHVRQEIYAIGREAIFNAYRHASAGNIEVELVYDAKEFRLFVRDDGIGLSDDLLNEGNKAAHWGLPGMKERATCLAGSIELRNQKGSGAEIALRIPAARAYSYNALHSRFGLRGWRSIDSSAPGA